MRLIDADKLLDKMEKRVSPTLFGWLCARIADMPTLEVVPVARNEANNTNDSVITLEICFEVHDSNIYGGKGSVGYANTKLELKVSALAKAGQNYYVEMHRQDVADMCQVDKEKVIIISRTDYEEATEDEDGEEYEDFYYCGAHIR